MNTSDAVNAIMGSEGFEKVESVGDPTTYVLGGERGTVLVSGGVVILEGSPSMLALATLMEVYPNASTQICPAPLEETEDTP